MLNIAKIRKEWFIEKVDKLKIEGSSYAEIAARLEVRPQYLNAIKNSERGASERLTLKLCKEFNINHNELLERIRIQEGQFMETSKVNEPGLEVFPPKRIPLSGNASDRPRLGEKDKAKEWIDVGDLFPDATSAIHHYGDNMLEYPPGSILVLKQVTNPDLIVWGRNYYVETIDFGVTKRLQDGGREYVIGYSSNEKTYPDGRLVHEPVKIPKKSLHRISLILGCVTKEFSKGVIPVISETL